MHVGPALSLFLRHVLDISSVLPIHVPCVFLSVCNFVGTSTSGVGAPLLLVDDILASGHALALFLTDHLTFGSEVISHHFTRNMQHALQCYNDE